MENDTKRKIFKRKWARKELEKEDNNMGGSNQKPYAGRGDGLITSDEFDTWTEKSGVCFFCRKYTPIYGRWFD